MSLSLNGECPGIGSGEKPDPGDEPKARFQAGEERGEWRRMGRATLIVTGLILAGRLVAGVREIAVAYVFGVNPVLDVYLLVFLAAMFLQTALSGALQISLVPRFVQVCSRSGFEAGRALFHGVAVRFLAGLGGVLILTALICVPLFHFLPPVAGAAERDLAWRLLGILLAASFAGGCSTVGSSMLNARGQFLVPGLASILNPVLSLGFFLVMHAAWGIRALAWGAFAGYVMELTVVGYALHRERLLSGFQRTVPGEETRHVFQQFLYVLGGSFIMGQTALVDQLMAAFLGPGNVSVLVYGGRVPTLILTVLAGALSTVLLPHFARSGAKDWMLSFRQLQLVGRMILLFSLPLVVGLVLGAEPMTRLLFCRGQFSNQDVQAVAGVTAFLSLQIPFYLSSIVAARFLSGCGRNQCLLWVSVANLIVSAVGDYVLMHYLGVAGIALCTVLIYLLALLMIMGIIRRVIDSIKTPPAQEA